MSGNHPSDEPARPAAEEVDPIRANNALWDEWTRIHETSAFYDLEGFKRGGIRLKAFELEEIGPVDGLELLHLQCHFGIDTLSWARLGARVTGADFSLAAVELALDTVGRIPSMTMFLLNPSDPAAPGAARVNVAVLPATSLIVPPFSASAEVER